MRSNGGIIKNRQYRCCGDEDPCFLLIQPVFGEELAETENMFSLIRRKTDTPFIYTAFEIRDWNKELSPWETPAVFGKEDFGAGASDTLTFIEKDLIPSVVKTFCPVPGIPVILGGYSLAGLFSLWSGCVSPGFAGIAAVSPSVWFPGFYEFVCKEGIHADTVYLSLGDREEKTRNKVMSSVGDCIRKLEDFLREDPQGLRTTLEWNEGNHFREPEERTARGFAWCIHEQAADSGRFEGQMQILE